MSARSTISGCIILALCAGCGGGGSGPSGASAPPPDLLASCPSLPPPNSPAGSLGAVVDAAALSEMATEELPGMTVSIAKNGTILYAQAYGYADLATCTPTQTDSVYMIASVTKQFTAAAILQLQNAGSLNIDNPVSTYLPNYTFDPRITVRMLLNQTTGLVDYTTLEQPSWFTPPGSMDGVSEQTVLTAVTQTPLLFTPGSRYAYSNSNYFVLGAVIEAVTSTSYADYMSAHIFQPAGLNHTSYLQPPTGIASPYFYTSTTQDSGLTAGSLYDPTLPFSAGALWSTVLDLATWDAALRNGTLIPPALFTEMVTPPAFESGLPENQQYAMGWVPTTSLGRSVVFHNGLIYGGYASINVLFPDDGFSISVLTNAETVSGTDGLETFVGGLIQSICAAPTTAGNC
jgi:D-alanyl-D-alanine carboxypeptidase